MLICLVSYLVCDTFHICLQVTYQVSFYLQFYLETYVRINMGMYLLICRFEGAGLLGCLEWYLAFNMQLSVQISLLIVLLKILPGAFFLPPPPSLSPPPRISFSFFAMLPNLFVILYLGHGASILGEFCCIKSMCTNKL